MEKNIKIIDGGITTPLGYKAAGVACGIKKNGNKDLAVIVSDCIADAAGVFTKNAVKGHSLQRTMKNMESGKARAIVLNSGNANACIGEAGDKAAACICDKAAETIGCQQGEILIGSTGVIGVPLDKDSINSGIDRALRNLSYDSGSDAAEAIMTTDTVKKEFAAEIDMNGKKVRLGVMAKGSGMIHVNMATMISIITTDAVISGSLLQKILSGVSEKTYNRVSVDGDTSVCDMVIALANGKAENSPIEEDSEEYVILKEAFYLICEKVSKALVKDGEGATKLVEVNVRGAKSKEDAYHVAVSVANSPLVKTALFGEDANWGRIITAIGYSGADIDPLRIDIRIGEVSVCESGCAIGFNEGKALQILKKDEINIDINLNLGKEEDRMFTCDFSYDYIKINGSYRS